MSILNIIDHSSHLINITLVLEFRDHQAPDIRDPQGLATRVPNKAVVLQGLTVSHHQLSPMASVTPTSGASP